MLLLLLFSLFAGIPPAVSEMRGYGDCRHPLLLYCGGGVFSISYPFTAVGRPGYCGFGDKYRVKCDDDGLVVEISGKSFLISAIDYQANVLSVEQRDECPSPELVSLNKEAPFEYTPDTYFLALLYNCSTTEDLPLHEVACLSSVQGKSYLVLDVPLAESLAGKLSCSSVGRVPVRRRAIEWPNVGHFLGFDVRWKAGGRWCRDCVNSGGACGYNSSQPDAPLCYCKESLSLRVCPAAKGTAFLRLHLCRRPPLRAVSFPSSLLVGFVQATRGAGPSSEGPPCVSF